MIRGTTRTTFTVVDHGSPDIKDSKPRGSSPASVVDLFAVEKEALVPGSHSVIACRRDHQESARGPVDLAHVVGEGVAHDFGPAPRASRPVITPDRFSQSPCRTRFATSTRPGCMIMIHQSGCSDSDIGELERCEEMSEGPRAQLDIGIHHQERFAGTSVLSTAVDGRGISAVVSQIHDLDVEMLAGIRDQRPAASRGEGRIARTRVDDADPHAQIEMVGEIRDLSGQGIEGGGKVIGAVMGDHDGQHRTDPLHCHSSRSMTVRTTCPASDQSRPVTLAETATGSAVASTTSTSVRAMLWGSAGAYRM